MPKIRSVIVHLDIPPADLGLPEDLRPIRAHTSYEGSDALEQAAVALGQWSPGRDLTASELLGTVARVHAELQDLRAAEALALEAAAEVGAEFNGAPPTTLADLGAWLREGMERRVPWVERLADLVGSRRTRSELIEAAALEIERLRAVVAAGGGSTSRRVVAVGDVLPLGEVPPGWVVRPQDGAGLRWLVGEGRDGVGVVSVTRLDLTAPHFSWGVWTRADDWGAGRQVEVVAGPLTPAQVLAIVEGDVDAGKRLARLAWGEADAADGLPVSPSAAPAPSMGEVRAIEDVPPGWIVGAGPDGSWAADRRAADRRVLVGELGRIPVLPSDLDRPSFWLAHWRSDLYVPTGERVELLAPVPAQVIAAAVAGNVEAGREIARLAYRQDSVAAQPPRPSGC